MRTTFLNLLLLSAFLPARGQGLQHKTLSLQECIDFALIHNENIKTANLEIDYQKQFKKGATEIPKTNVLFAQGQFNSLYKYDNSVTVMQQIPFPAVFSAHNALAKSYIKGSELKLAATRADLIYQIKNTYYSLLYYDAIHHLLEKEDSIYQSFAESGKLKYESGGGSLLEKTTSETKVLEIKNQLLENEEDINAAQIQLQTLLNSDSEISAVDEDLTLKPLTMNSDSGNYLYHPYLEYLHQQIIAGKKNKLLELYRIFPDLQVGYWNLSIYGPADYGAGPYTLTTKDRLQGLLLGINIPLWFYPQTARIKAAEIKTEVAKSDYSYNKTVFEGQFRQAHTLYLKYQKSINYYKSTALTNSQTIITQALKSYKANEINYIEYLNVVSNALDIESNYLNVIYQNDLAVLKIEYLLSK
ncbi:MAG: TolC family protein [Bacteroidia bacterium]